LNACTNLVALFVRDRPRDNFPHPLLIPDVGLGETIADVDLIGED